MGASTASVHCIYRNAFESGAEARSGIGVWISYHSERRPHSSHGLPTPAEAYDTSPQDPESRRLT
ncbi:integrase core domain-containing protein [Roseovarius sp. TE539]|uniref:integrase core domain-containing protein n=1 Tax=Roseovarius sp. TE539 TaxID=2249812 RepID=UPI0015EFB707